VRYVFKILGVYSAKDEMVYSSEPMGEAACVSEPECTQPVRDEALRVYDPRGVLSQG
jgi:hypothetical protein